MNHFFLAVDDTGEPAVRLRLCQRFRLLNAVGWSLAMFRGRHQVVEDSGRAHDGGPLGMSQRYLDDFDPEPGGIGVLARHAGGAAGKLAG